MGQTTNDQSKPDAIRKPGHSAIDSADDRFRTMVENLPAGAVYRQGEKLWLNRAVQRLIGYSQKEIQTVDDWFKKIHPGTSVESQSRYEAFRNEGFPRPETSSFTCKSGEIKHCELTGYLDEECEIWLVNDVTARLASEQKFRILFDNSSTPYFLFGREGVLDCNAAALEQLGVSDKRELIGRSFSSFSPQEQADGVSSLVRLAEVNVELDATGRCTFEWTHFRSDGTLSQVFVSASKFKIGPDTMELVVWQDLTRIKKAEARLRESEARYRTIFDHTNEIIYTLSLKGRFTFVSPSWTRHLGHSVDDVIGHRFIEFVHPDDRAKGAEYTKRLFKDPSYRGSCIYRAVHKDRSFRWHETNGSVVMDADGKPLHFVGLSRDVTEKLEDQQALEIALQAAEASSLAKSQFLATVSHEIRTPLNGIMGMTNLLADTALSDDQASFVKTIQSSSVILRRVIDDVLDFSRMEAGKLSISPTAVDAVAALQEVVSLYQGAAVGKGITLGLDWFGVSKLEVFADPARVKQVVANLVHNGIKFTEVGGVMVKAHIARETKTAVILRIEVSDTGIGIPADRKNAIFEGFTQADSTMHRQFGGSGLGLTISQRLTDLMGGSIGVESEPGVGSMFWVELPLSKAEAKSKANKQVRPERLDGLRVLLAEDNEVNVEVAKRQIERLGCFVDIASNGVEAVAMSGEHDYDIVLMDVQMPEMDGLEATRCIRSRELDTKKRVPIVALTATAFAEDKKACEDAGMDAFLSKPFHPDELEAQLKEGIFRSRDDTAVTASSE